MAAPVDSTANGASFEDIRKLLSEPGVRESVKMLRRRFEKSSRKGAVVTVLIFSLTASFLIVSASSGASTSGPVTVSVPVQPDALVYDGTNMWVASCKGNAITAINGATKAIEMTLTDSTFGFNCPYALAFDGKNVWVANQRGNTLTEVNAQTGDLVRIVSGTQILFPIALVVMGSDIWVASAGPNFQGPAFLSEFNIATGLFVKTIFNGFNSRWNINEPICLASSGSNLWEAGSLNFSGVNEFNADTGKFERTLVDGTGSGCVTYERGEIWISSSNGSVIGEFRASSGIREKTLRLTKYLYVSARELIFTGKDFIVETESSKDAIAEFSANGAFVRFISRSTREDGLGISSFAMAGNTVWTANFSSNSVTIYEL